MAKELFGTDGIRGEPGKPPLDDATLYAAGRALGTYLAKQNRAPRVMIGMDTRGWSEGGGNREGIRGRNYDAGSGLPGSAKRISSGRRHISLP
jgi:phosphoglucomutase/phosphomannomutase-like protein